jgi:hypothetical protein
VHIHRGLRAVVAHAGVLVRAADPEPRQPGLACQLLTRRCAPSRLQITHSLPPPVGADVQPLAGKYLLCTCTDGSLALYEVPALPKPSAEAEDPPPVKHLLLLPAQHLAALVGMQPGVPTAQLFFVPRRAPLQVRRGMRLGSGFVLCVCVYTECLPWVGLSRRPLPAARRTTEQTAAARRVYAVQRAPTPRPPPQR